MEDDLPHRIGELPHWRVNFRPDDYRLELISSLAECLKVVEKNVVRLRGWDYPHVSNQENELIFGANWAGSWTEFASRKEYWRMYQSGQFIHLFTTRESVPEYKQRLMGVTRDHLRHLREIRWDQITGYINIQNTLYTLTEIFEFCARLCQAGLYKGTITVSVQLRQVKGTLLTTDWNRAWFNYYAAAEPTVGHVWKMRTDQLISESSAYSIRAAIWFFERFGWLDASSEQLKRDQEEFLNKRL